MGTSSVLDKQSKMSANPMTEAASVESEIPEEPKVSVEAAKVKAEAIEEITVKEKNIPNKIDEFLCMIQQPEESATEYAARLTNAAKFCDFQLPAGQSSYAISR